MTSNTTWALNSGECFRRLVIANPPFEHDNRLSNVSKLWGSLQSFVPTIVTTRVIFGRLASQLGAFLPQNDMLASKLSASSPDLYLGVRKPVRQ